MTRMLLILSLLANATVGYLYVQLHADHDRLLTWACEHASLGGYECGEM